MAKLTRQEINIIFDRVKLGTANSLEIELAYKLKLHAVQKDYSLYCQALYSEVEWLWFQQYIQKQLNEVLDRGYGFIIIEMPPQHAKTTLGSTLCVPYVHGRFPDKKVILAAYGGDRAKSNAKLISDTMSLDTYKEIFPARTKKTFDKEIDNMYEVDGALVQTAYGWNLSTNPRGSFLATSVGGVLTGESGDILILDDYNKDSNTARSAIERQNTFDWFTSSFYSRKQINTVIIVFATRWHSDDLIGRLKVLNRSNPEIFDFKLITFPALQTEDAVKRTYDPRIFGEPLWPDKMQDYLVQQHLSLENFAALYQQSPVTEQGVIFEARHLIEYSVLPEHFDMIVIGVDTSYKATAVESDDCAMVVLGKINKNWYLIEFIARRMRFIETVEEAKRLKEKYNCRTMVIEEKANGVALIEMLQKDLVGMNIIGCDMGPMSKRAKAEMTTPIFANGNFHVPSKASNPEIEKYRTQFLQFTGDRGGKDDCVDATVVVLLKLGDLEYRIPKGTIHITPNLSSKITKGNPLGRKNFDPFACAIKNSSLFDGASSKSIASRYI